MRHLTKVLSSLPASHNGLGAPRARPAGAARGTGPPRATALGGPGDEVPRSSKSHTRSLTPDTPLCLAQWAQQYITPPASTPCPMTLHRQWAHMGASAWIAHSKLSKIRVVPPVMIWKALS